MAALKLRVARARERAETPLQHELAVVLHRELEPFKAEVRAELKAIRASLAVLTRHGAVQKETSSEVVPIGMRRGLPGEGVSHHAQVHPLAE